MKFDRTRNAKKTIVSGFLVKTISVIVPFVMRTIIIHTLGNLYLGLGSLFSAVLNALSLAELGVGSALVFSMYKPVAENDTTKVCALLNVYKKIYFFIGCAILAIGLLLIPFLPKLISGDYPGDINIYTLYIIQLISTISGYFLFAYRGSVLTAYQRVDLINMVTFITEMAMYALQIIALVFFKNYYIYVCLILVRTIAFNGVVYLIAKRKYPYIKAVGNIDKATKTEVIRKIGALTGHKIAEVVVNSTDNILISMFIGLNMVAIYNNYYYVVTAISGILMTAFTGLISIVGNYLISETSKKVNDLFDVLSYINAFVVAVCCTSFINMYQPFITIWTGKDNLFPMYMVILFSAYFYILRIRTVISLFCNAAGIWEKDLRKAYIMTLINLLIDITLMPIIGIPAALISTIVSMIFAFIYETFVIHKYVLKKDIKNYCLKNILYLMSIILATLLSLLIMPMYESVGNIGRLIIGAVVSIIISVVCFLGLTFKCKEFSESIVFIKRKIRRL